MMEQTNLVPKRRFREFKDNDAWEQHELGNVLDNQYNGQTPSRANISFWNGDINWLSSGELNRGVVSKTIEKITESGRKNANLKIVPKGTFVMAITGLEAAGTRGNCAKLGIDTTLNQSCMALYPNEKLLNSSFLFQWYRKVGEEYGLKYTQGTKQQSYNAELIKILPITLPSVTEQIQIADFFDNLESLITLHQRKLDKTKALKSAYLSEMFPAEGENVPKRRFAGFTQAWEQRKLADIASHRGGTAIEKYFDKRGEYKVISIGSYGLDSKYIDQNIRALSNEITDGRVVRKGELTMVLNDKTSNGTIIGRSLLIDSDDEYVINQRTEIISPKDNFDSNFAYVVLNGPFREKVKKFVQGGTQIYVNYSTIENLIINLPSIEEQQQIGKLFQDLDNLITLQQRKLGKLQKIKKAYLNEMFV